MEVCVGRFVHISLCPFLEGLGIDGFISVVLVFLAVEVVAGFHLQKAIDLLTH